MSRKMEKLVETNRLRHLGRDMTSIQKFEKKGIGRRLNNKPIREVKESEDGKNG